jgi:hypothetical protein
MWLSEADRTRRGLVVSRPCVDPFKCGDECRDYRDYYRDDEKHGGGTVAIPLVTHEGASALAKTLCGLDSSPRGMEHRIRSAGAGQSFALLGGIHIPVSPISCYGICSRKPAGNHLLLAEPDSVFIWNK